MCETTEQQLLEMSKHMKELVEQKDQELKEYKIKYMKSKKLITKFYGMVCILQEELEHDWEDVSGWILTEMRSKISDYVFEKEEKELDIYGY